jgi:hypothetical protein
MMGIIILTIVLGSLLYYIMHSRIEGIENKEDGRVEIEALLESEQEKSGDIKVLENDIKIYNNSLKCFEHREKQLNAKVNEAVNAREIQKEESNKKTTDLIDMVNDI